MIGPFRGGRVAAVSGVAGDPTTFYFGSVGGGVWKTTNAGVTWSPIFDSQPIASIGAIAVAPSNPNVIYVGTGEADIRSQIGFGDGVYKSTDAGQDLDATSASATRGRSPAFWSIRAIPTWSTSPRSATSTARNAERGVFRSTDGGRTWTKVLDRGPETGAVDLAFDPANSQDHLRHRVERAPSGVEPVRAHRRSGQRAVQDPPMAATTGPSSPATDCPNRSGGAAASPSRRADGASTR